MNALKYAIGTGFYSGRFPKAPGTAGSFFFLIPLYFILPFNYIGLNVFVVIATSALSLWVAPYFEARFSKDPGILVMDEWAGQSLSFLTIMFTGTPQNHILILLIGFALFRFFDILKPLGIKKVQNLPGGWGILVDDLLAGLYTLICLESLIFIWPEISGIL